MSSRKANLLAAAAKCQRLSGLWQTLESGTTLRGPPGGKFRSLSSNATSSIHYDRNDSRSNTTRVSPSKPLNGIHSNESNGKHAIVPTKTNGEASPKSAASKSNLEEPNVNGKNLPSARSSPSELAFAGDAFIPVTSHLHIVTPSEDTPRGTWPIFRIMDEDGTFRDGSNDGYHNDEEKFSKDSFQNIPVNGAKIDGSSNEKGLDSSLSDLRALLSQQYPYQSLEIECNGLLLQSKSVFPDTNSKNTLKRLLRHMIRLREMDSIFQNAQRQGRVSFYLTCRGEEAIHFGATSALENQDVILGQYREQGPLMWRGFTLQQFSDQCFSNASDLGKGRQMPIHYGSRALNYQTISSPLGTQIPQAVGVAMRLKNMAAAGEGKKGIAMCFFGEGCTSTTDFHSGLNFAATLKCPVIFFCRNNGYAISTSVKEQYASDGVVSKAPGYGMAGIRVDGNDVFAVHAAVREARAYALEHNAPVLIEGMTYRQGHHSTSDDSSQYRSIEEVEDFAQKCDPLDRLKNFFKLHEYDEMTDDRIESIIQEEKKAILDAMRTAEKKPKPPLEDLFTDVYKEMPPSLQSQWDQLSEHMEKYPDEYKM